ncbi:MAG: hypothetical protein JKY34_10380 [Kordiimonadaceae bacterium]|nr:hypothetical protein [Kordiimonadaceae bacterium]
MAKPAGKKPLTKKRPVRRAKKEMNPFMPILLICLGGLALFKMGAAILLAAGLVPTIVLGITGKGSFKSEKLQCVSFMNLSGVLTQFPTVWARPNSVYDIIGEPINLLVMWGAAGFGYALIFVGPMIAAFAVQMLAQERTKSIIQQKQALVELWGTDVLGSKDDEPAASKSKLKK